MKNIMFLVFLCAFLGAKGQDFRNAKFGMTKQEVRSNEPLKLKAANQFLMSIEKEQIGGIEMMVSYSFDESQKFDAGMYITYMQSGGNVLSNT